MRPFHPDHFSLPVAAKQYAPPRPRPSHAALAGATLSPYALHPSLLLLIHSTCPRTVSRRPAPSRHLRHLFQARYGSALRQRRQLFRKLRAVPDFSYASSNPLPLIFLAAESPYSTSSGIEAVRIWSSLIMVSGGAVPRTPGPAYSSASLVDPTPARRSRLVHP